MALVQKALRSKLELHWAMLGLRILLRLFAKQLWEISNSLMRAIAWATHELPVLQDACVISVCSCGNAGDDPDPA